MNLLVPPKNPDAQMGFIVMEPEDTPPMSGSNSMCVSTVLLDSGIIPMQEPVTEMVLEAPGGLVRIRAQCKNGKAESITVQNLPSFADGLDQTMEVEGLGTLTVDTAFGGDSFVMVDASALGFEVVASEARDLALTGIRITNAANEQIGFRHPELPEWNHISFCLFVTPAKKTDEGFSGRSTVAIQPGKLDRSPCGTGVSALMATLSARGLMKAGDLLNRDRSSMSRFVGKIAGETQVGDRKAIIPELTGRAWITGVHQHMLDPDDPWPGGYRISDTWGVN